MKTTKVILILGLLLLMVLFVGQMVWRVTAVTRHTICPTNNTINKRSPRIRITLVVFIFVSRLVTSYR